MESEKQEPDLSSRASWDNLRQCPFCGGEAAIVKRTVDMVAVEEYAITCIDCAIEGGYHESINEAATQWNQRPKRHEAQAFESNDPRAEQIAGALIELARLKLGGVHNPDEVTLLQRAAYLLRSPVAEVEASDDVELDSPNRGIVAPDRTQPPRDRWAEVEASDEWHASNTESDAASDYRPDELEASGQREPDATKPYGGQPRCPRCKHPVHAPGRCCRIIGREMYSQACECGAEGAPDAASSAKRILKVIEKDTENNDE